jgi:predicted AlkP superfamily pyrophosphatase or phosphodiesterase
VNQSEQVVLFLVDGMRPDGMLQAETPAMDALRAGGAHTLSARTVMPSMTLPCHASLFLGVPPARHGITTNTWMPQVRPVPGLFDVLHETGLVTAAFYNWEELRDLSRPGALNISVMIKDVSGDGAADTAVADMAAAWLGSHPFNFAFVYLGGTDIAGHAFGWMSEPYLAAISHADRCIAAVLQALPADCTVIVTSDHGGHEQTHGTAADEDMTTPLIIRGPAVPAGTMIAQAVQITDIAPTVTALFGVPAPDEWIGQPVITR